MQTQDGGYYAYGKASRKKFGSFFHCPASLTDIDIIDNLIDYEYMFLTDDEMYMWHALTPNNLYQKWKLVAEIATAKNCAIELL